MQIISLRPSFLLERVIFDHFDFLYEITGAFLLSQTHELVELSFYQPAAVPTTSFMFSFKYQKYLQMHIICSQLSPESTDELHEWKWLFHVYVHRANSYARVLLITWYSLTLLKSGAGFLVSMQMTVQYFWLYTSIECYTVLTTLHPVWR